MSHTHNFYRHTFLLKHIYFTFETSATASCGWLCVRNFLSVGEGKCTEVLEKGVVERCRRRVL